MQNAKQCLPDCFYMWNCANGCNTTLVHNMFLILQTIYTNWGRRLAVRAPNERLYELFCVCTQNKWRSLTAATDDTQPSYKQKRSGNMFCILQTCYPTTIFHFPFSILHLIKPFARYFRQRFAPFIRHRRRS